MKTLSILILEHFFLNLVSLKEVRQRISHSISFFLTIIDLKMVLRELLGPIDLIRAQVFCIHELTELIMISKDKNLVFAAFHVMTSSLKGFNNSQQLLIVSLVLSLSGDHFLRKRSYWMPLTNFRFRKNWIQFFVGYVIRKRLVRIIQMIQMV